MSRDFWKGILLGGACGLFVSVILLATNNTKSNTATAGVATTAAATTSSGSTSSEPAAPPAPKVNGASGQIAGAGASSQQAAQEAWIAAFQKGNSSVTISYDPVGSGGGREQFGAGAVVYGGSDVPLEGSEFTAGQKRCGGVDNLIEAPIYVSPIALVYNLSGITDLKLDANTIASIFAGKITKWNDPAIAATNPGVNLPDTAITPVHRSDSSGTTENFANYMSATAPKVWTYKPASEWPISSGEAAQGTSGVIAAVKAGDGTIGYADESQAGSLAKAEVKVGSEFVAPSAASAGRIFAASKQTSEPGKYVFAYHINYATTEAGTYPIVLVSYMLACTKYSNANDAKIIQGYLDYVASPAGQSTAANAAGSAPLPADVGKQIQAAAGAIKTS
jgi:phosphate transport system substrate-binding protein